MKKEHKIEAGGVALREKTRLRARDKMEPTPRMKEGIERAREAHYERPIPPGVMVLWDEEKEQWDLDAPHREIEAWEVHICEAFATRSHAVMWSFLTQLAHLAGKDWVVHNGAGHNQPNELLLNFALGVIHSEQPETPMQAMLCAQMVATHLMQMKASKEAMHSYHQMDNRLAAQAGKMARTFAMQMDALRRAKGKVPTQHIQVSYERHVHHHQHVHMEGGGGDNFGDQPQTANRNRPSDSNQTSDRQARHLAGPDSSEVVELEGRATVPGEDKARDPLPSGGPEGKDPMQAPRMRSRGGRSER